MQFADTWMLFDTSGGKPVWLLNRERRHHRGRPAGLQQDNGVRPPMKKKLSLHDKAKLAMKAPCGKVLADHRKGPAAPWPSGEDGKP